MQPKFFDAHAHVQFAAFEKDYKEVIKRALENGVQMINVGTQKDTSKRAVEIAHEFDGVYAAVGLHPIHTAKSFHDTQELGGGESAQAFISRGEEFDFDYYKKLALDPKTVAIGECGLDYFRLDAADREEQIGKQKDVFLLQIKLAAAVEKPLMIHCRNAFGDLIEILRNNLDPRFRGDDPRWRSPGVVHFFTGTNDDAKQLLDLGFSFTFGGVITFTRDYDEVITMIPLKRILSETDAPYVSPVPYRGKRNEPAYVVETVKTLAELKGISPEEMRDSIARNAETVFPIHL